MRKVKAKIKVALIIAASCIAVIALAYVGHRGLRVWRQKHGIALANQYLAKGDERNAALCLQQVLTANPRNLTACRIMARLADASHSQTALIWHRRILDLDPRSLDDRLALAQAALLNHNFPLATNTLADATMAEKNTEPFHIVAGTVALAGGQIAEAESHFSQAAQLDPRDPAPAVDLAVVRLHGTNAQTLAEARTSLQNVILNSTNTVFCNQARRELIVDAMRFKHTSTALKLADELVQQPDTTFEDQLLRLEILKRTQNPGFDSALAACKSEAQFRPTDVVQLAQWQSANLSATAALQWLQTLPEQTKTNLTVEILTANFYQDLKDWRGLQAAIQHESWTDSSQPGNGNEFLRHAYLAHSLREQNLPGASDAEWDVAVKAANDSRSSAVSRGKYHALFALAAAWKWDNDAEQILWIFVNQYPDETWACPALRGILLEGHRTRSLMKLLSIMHKRDPNNLVTRNDLAATALLLGAQEVNPCSLAQSVYEKAPDSPSFACTYAYALLVKGQAAEALKVMQRLSPTALRDPSIAGYYGLILKANGDISNARTYLKLATGPTLLPEELTLFQRAQQGL